MESRLPQPVREALLNNEMQSAIRLLAMALSGLVGAGGISLLFHFLWGSNAAIAVGSFVLILTSFTIFRALRSLDQPLRNREVMDKELLNTLVSMDRRAILITTQEGSIVTFNGAYERICGDHVRGLPDLVDNDKSRDDVRALIRRVAQHGSATAEFESGSGKREKASINIIGRRVGNYLLWRISVINDRARLDHEINAFGTVTGEVLERIGCAVVLEDGTGRPQFINKVMADWLGLDRNVGLPSKVILKADDTQLLIDNKRRIDVDVIDVPLQTREEHRSIGRYRILRKLEDIQGRAVASGKGLLIDPVFNAAPISIAVVDRECGLVEANPVLNRSKVGKTLHAGDTILSLVKDEDQSELKELIEGTYDGKAASYPLDVVFSGGDERVGKVFATSIAREDERYALLYILDTTQEKSLERQFVQAQKMQAVGQLAGGVAHDFNNLLTAIIGFCDLLLVRHDAGDQSFSDIIQIKQNANRAANLVRQLLAFSRQQTLRPKVLMLTDVLAEISNLIRRLIGENIDLKVVHGRDLSPVKVDQGQLEQVIINLAVNARDAMSEGGRLEIRTSMVGPDHPLIDKYEVIVPDDYVLIEVEDTGCGISQENLGKIFEPFFTTKAVGQGTGLGLATVYGIVKQTGGFVFVDSVLGKGTTFLLFLKAHQAVEEEQEEEEVELPVKDLTGKGTILVVEDEDPVRMFACRALTNKGYKVLEAASGEAGLEILQAQEEKIDLLISDVIMPTLDGPTLVKEARKLLPELPVIFVSGYAEDVFRENLEAEEFHYLPKPFSLNELAEKVKEILR